MYAAEYHRRYTEAQVTSVDRGRLLLLLFEGGLTFLGRAREGLVAGDLPRFGEQLSRAQAVIAELLGSLDYERGGEIAKELARLYDFMLYRLTEANIEKSVVALDDVLRILPIIAGAFRDAIEGVPVAPAAQAV